MNQSEARSVEKPPIAQRLSGSRYTKWILLVVVASLAIIAIGYWYWESRLSVVGREIASEASFTVYAPKHAPAGYQIERDQVNLGNNILSYEFSSQSADKRITVTVQPRPPGFDVAELTKGGSISSTVTDNGALYDLSVGGVSQYLLDTGDSLVYLTSPGSVDVATINQLANSLQKLN